MKEFNFIERLTSVSLESPYGIGDDAAVVNNTLISKDIFAEGVHFSLQEPMEEIIERVFIANISDIAAMGGRCEGYSALLGLSIPKNIDKEILLKSIIAASKKYKVKIVGGDTTSSLSHLFISLTILGEPNKNILARSNAKMGDLIYLSRVTGLSKYSLENRLEGIKTDYHFPPEQTLGDFLGKAGGVGACIDISDGLGIDLSHIASQSKVKIILDDIPLPALDMPEEKRLEYAISSGEEFALAFTVRPDVEISIIKLIEEKLRQKVYKIGFVEEGEGCFHKIGDIFVDISQKGYEHF